MRKLGYLNIVTEVKSVMIVKLCFKFLGLLPVRVEGETAEIKICSLSTFLSTIWSLFPAAFLVYEQLFIIQIVDSNADVFVVHMLSMSGLNILKLLVSPLLRAKVIVKSKVPMSSHKFTYKIVLLIGFFTLLGGFANLRLMMYVSGTDKLLDFITALLAYACVNIQTVSEMLVFNIAINNILENLDTLENGIIVCDVLSSYSGVIRKYKLIQKSSEMLLFTLCAYFGVNIMFTAYLAAAIFKSSLLFFFTFGSMTIGFTLYMYVLSNLAEDAYERLLAQETKIR